LLEKLFLILTIKLKIRMRKLTLGEKAEYNEMNEDDIISYHKLLVGNYFGLERSFANEIDLDIARFDIEKIESKYRKYYLYQRAFGLE